MTPRRIAVAVVVHEGRVLVGRRPASAAEAAGFDEFPGGKIEPHESVAEAAARECLEEAGVAIRMIERRPAVAVPQAEPPLTILFHWAAPLDPAARPRPPFEWVPLADLATRKFPEANAAVLAMLRRDGDHGGS